MREKIRDKGRLEHILNAIANVIEFTKDATFEDMLSSKLLFYAVVKNIEIVEEGFDNENVVFQKKPTFAASILFVIYVLILNLHPKTRPRHRNELGFRYHRRYWVCKSRHSRLSQRGSADYHGFNHLHRRQRRCY